MGLRFRKTISILPGLKMNLSKSGMSLTIGRRGRCMNFSPRGTSFSVGIPGTGISYRASTSYKRRHSKSTAMRRRNDNVQQYSRLYNTWGSSRLVDIEHTRTYKWHKWRERHNEIAAQWGCASLLVGLFLFFGFLILGQNPTWAFGSLAVFGFLFALGVGHVSHFVRWFIRLFKHKPRKYKYYQMRLNTDVAAVDRILYEQILSEVPQSTLDYFTQIDPLFVEAAIFVYMKTWGSTSSIQRRFSLGYNRAGKIIDHLIELGLCVRNNNRTISPTVRSIDDLLLALESITI